MGILLARPDVAILDPADYRRVAEWEWGPQEGADWARYAEEMNHPKWMHFGLYAGGELAGRVSLEKIGRNMAAYHVVTARRRVHPQALAQILLDTAAYLFERGFIGLVARIPRERRAAAALALRCGMREWGNTPRVRYFMLTRKRFQNQEADHGWRLA